MFCDSCGKEIADGMMFCSNCGKKVETPSASGKDSKTEFTVGGSASFKGSSDAFKRFKPKSATTPVSMPKFSVKIQKNQVINFILWVLLFAVCTAIVIMFELALTYEEGVQITSAFDDKVVKYMNLSSLIGFMYNGYTGFSPTVASIILSVSIFILKYSLPFILLIMFIGTVTGQKKVMWHTSFSIISIVSAAVLSAVVPLTKKFVPGIKTVLSSELCILRDDIGSITFTPLILYAAAIIGLIIVSYILLFVLLRRKKNEKVRSYIK